MSEITDLNALVPQSHIIRIGNPPKEIEILPPNVGDTARLGILGQKMQSADSMSPDDLDKLSDDIKALVVKMIPQLSEELLNTAQLLKLVEILSNMVIIPEQEKGKAEPDGPKKDKG